MSSRERARKPDVSEAMKELIEQVREVIPFDIPPAQLCDGPCTGCPKKLIEYLDTELEEWEYRIKQDQQPTLGDLHSLGKTSRKIHAVLKKNDLVRD
ncbi:hypothetical protein [uncultured Neptuniibacter sp.]|uniref:hypothetical protein n=1 Tax=uncultured Neptuniibacter sp. TaxID=502143 RepID=UPI0026268B5F|nr:hypothetical protein [uncultured Neptuniibacter sp.]